MATKIRLKRLGKIRTPHYRVVVMDSRAKRDGRAIEEIGQYHPKADPSVIVIDSERVQYWLGVGAQPSETVLALLKVTGDWQKFKGLPGAEGFGNLQQSYLEEANVNAVTEISSLIAAQRAYEMNSKVVSAADQMMQSTSNLFR